MKIATWNVNGLRARLDFILHWLEARQPDVVGLQELKMPDEQVPTDAFEAAGYVITPFGQKGWNGVAVLSREPVEVVQKGLPGQEKFGARLLTVRVPDLTFTTVYCPNGKSVDHPDYRRKLEWYDSLVEHLDEMHDPGRPHVLCGDFNICPGPLDSWNEELLGGGIFHTPEERQRFQRLLDWGLVDLFRARYPEEQRFSWWDYRAGAFHKNQGLRIDAVLGTGPIAERLVEAEIDRDYRKKKDGLTASDHAPVSVDLE